MYTILVMDPRKPITLFDINSNLTPKAFDSYGWRVRLALNYKNLHHETKWIWHDEISPIVSNFGVRANPRPPLYTIPVIRASNRIEVIMNCADIVTYLDTEYDFLKKRIIAHGTRDLQLAQVDAINEILVARIVPMVIPIIVETIPEGPHRDHWSTAMQNKFGIPIDQMYPPEKREAMWDGVKGALNRVAELAGEQTTDSPWLFGGISPNYVDFSLCGVFIMLERVGPQGGWDRVKGLNGGIWSRLYEACRPWMVVK